MNVKIYIYDILVNRNKDIQLRYRRLRNKVSGIGRAVAWIYLIFLNLYCLICGESVFEALMTQEEEKSLLLNQSESSWGGQKSADELIEKLMKYDVISFDVFDTLIFRPLAAATDLFFLVGERLGYQNFEYIRRETERKVRHEKRKTHGHTEVTLDEIYANLWKDAGIDRLKGQEEEFRIEKELCMPNPYMSKVYRTLKERGKKIVIISDMYLEKYRMKQLLDKCGYTDYAALYVSNEFGDSKADGTLYNRVMREMGVNRRYIHVGDNYISDVEQAKKAGWESAYYTNVNELGNRYRTKDMSRIVGSAYAGVVNSHIYNGLRVYSREYEYGYIYGGILVLGYCRFIHRYAQMHGSDRILFLARDGEILKKVYDKMFPGEETVYTYWSRSIAVKMSAAYYKYDYFLRFLYHKVNQKKTMEEILEDMDLGDMADLLKEEQLDQSSILTDKNVDALKKFLNKRWNAVLRHYEKLMEAGKKYITQVIAGAENVCVVDIGWAGSGAMALKYLVEDVWKMPCNITGIIAGTNTVHNAERDAGEAQLQSSQLVSYLFNQGMNRDIWKKHDLNRGDNLYMELLMSSPTPSCKGFELTEEGEVKVLFGIPERNPEGIIEIQKGIMDFVEKYCKCFQKYPYMFDISGRDAYAPFLLAMGNKREYLKQIYSSFMLKEGI